MTFFLKKFFFRGSDNLIDPRASLERATAMPREKFGLTD
jgi:hypothetical protein